jgi:hypothetical protein
MIVRTDTVTTGDQQNQLHPHALQQAASRVGLPWAYARHLLDDDQQPWGQALLAHNLNRLFEEHTGNARFLLRSVGGEVRGFLSDRFRRLDSRPIVDAFALACGQVGALPVEGYMTDTKMAIKALLPRVYEPVQHEVMAFGAVLENSDFGNGALAIRAFCLRLWCTNYAIADVGTREVHLGGRLPEDITFSEETYNLDTRRMASAVGDVVRGQLAPARVEMFLDAIRKANDDKIDPRQVGQALRKTLNKREVEQVVEAFNSPDVEMLPPGNTTWRLSNAVSWVAGQTTDAERKLDLMKAAGALLSKAA